jgi:hypothetical protein
MKKYSVFLIVLVLFLICFTSCITKTTQPSSPSLVGTQDYLQTTAKVYPAPGDSLFPNSPGEMAYPALEIKNLTSENYIRFQLDKPVYEGTIELRGNGPAGIQIVIADVTFFGEVIVKGFIDLDGSFLIELPKPLEKAHRIGIALGDLKGTKWENVDLSDPGFFGDEFQQVPMVGFFYDTVLVQGK